MRWWLAVLVTCTPKTPPPIDTVALEQPDARSTPVQFVLDDARAPNHLELLVGEQKRFPRPATGKDLAHAGPHFDLRQAGDVLLVVGTKSGRDTLLWILPDGTQETWTIDVHDLPITDVHDAGDACGRMGECGRAAIEGCCVDCKTKPSARGKVILVDMVFSISKACAERVLRAPTCADVQRAVDDPKCESVPR